MDVREDLELRGDADVVAVVGLGWSIIAATLIAGHFGVWRRLISTLGLGSWVGRVRFRELLPFVGWFVLFAAFDVTIQGMASRAFRNRSWTWSKRDCISACQEGSGSGCGNASRFDAKLSRISSASSAREYSLTSWIRPVSRKYSSSSWYAPIS